MHKSATIRLETCNKPLRLEDCRCKILGTSKIKSLVIANSVEFTSVQKFGYRTMKLLMGNILVTIEIN